MRLLKVKAAIAAGAMLLAIPGFAQNEGQGQGQAVVTVLPAHGHEMPANLTQQDLTLKVNGKDSTITNFTPLRGANGRLELVIMMDSGARTSLSTQLGEIANFVKSLPPDAKVTLAYMENGIARLSGPLTNVRSLEIARMRDLRGQADVAPVALVEEPFHFALEDRRIGVEPIRDPARSVVVPDALERSFRSDHSSHHRQVAFGS